MNERVSIYADLSGKCKRGQQKLSNENKLFIANGVSKLQRFQLFGDDCKPWLVLSLFLYYIHNIFTKIPMTGMKEIKKNIKK